MKSTSIAACLVFSVISHTPAFAQAVAVRAEAPPAIDGRLEDAWRAGRLFDAFVQIEPDIDPEPALRTEIYFLYDTETVFLAARMTQPAASVRSTRGRRDAASVTDGDYVACFLDPAASGNAAYFFLVNPSNAIQDGVLDVSGVRTTEWDGRFVSAATVDEQGWSVEIRIPLDTLGFQNRPVQHWGILCERQFARDQRRYVSHLADRNQPFQIAAFPQLLDLRDLAPASRYAATPYVSGAVGAAPGAARSRAEAGADLDLRPTPAMTALVTVNPDFAQLESDREIINVSDVPESYPEKRPFFTLSSDLYPGLAVNTRRIHDIVVGAKLRHVLETVKYDVTAVADTDDARWVLANIRWTNSRTFHAEAIAGLKAAGSDTDYNVTTNVRGWWLGRRLSAYNWIGTVNSRHRAGNEWEAVSAVRWDSRIAHVGLWNHLKTDYYDPSIVGHATLANEILVKSWAEVNRFSDDGRLRVLAPRIEIDRVDLFSDPGHAFWTVTAKLRTQIDVGTRLGLIDVAAAFMVPSDQTFRDRTGGDGPYADAFGAFALVAQRRSLRSIEIATQPASRFSGSVAVGSDEIRGSDALTVNGHVSWRLGEAARASYELERVRLDGSPWQPRLTEQVHRLRLEYNFTDRLNIRGILGLHTRASAGPDALAGRTPDQQITVSWERSPGSFVYVVYTDAGPTGAPGRDRSMAFKVTQRLAW